MAIQHIGCRNYRGFTLIELMIVIAVIGILAAIAVPNFVSYRDKAFCSAADADLDAVMAAISDYFSNPINLSVSKPSLSLTDGAGGDLSHGNTYSISKVTTNSYRIVVTDATGRCPRFDTVAKTLQ